MAARDIDELFQFALTCPGTAEVKVFPEGRPPPRVPFTRRVRVRHVHADTTFEASFDILATRGEANVDVARRALSGLELCVGRLKGGRVLC